MVVPEPAVAPVMPPVMAPIVQLKVLGTEANKEIPVFAPLQMVTELAVVTAGAGLTVTVIAKGAPEHELAVDVGVTKY